MIVFIVLLCIFGYFVVGGCLTAICIVNRWLPKMRSKQHELWHASSVHRNFDIPPDGIINATDRSHDLTTPYWHLLSGHLGWITLFLWPGILPGFIVAGIIYLGVRLVVVILHFPRVFVKLFTYHKDRKVA